MRTDAELQHTAPKRNRGAYQFSLRTLFVMTAVAAVLCGIVAAIIRVLPEDPTGPVNSPSKWPKDLKDLLTAADENEIPFGSVQVYCVHKGWSEEDYWRLPASPELLQLMMDRWSLVPATATQSSMFWNDMPAGWGPSASAPRMQYLISPGYGRKSGNYVVMINPESQFVYVRYYFNF